MKVSQSTKKPKAEHSRLARVGEAKRARVKQFDAWRLRHSPIGNMVDRNLDALHPGDSYQFAIGGEVDTLALAVTANAGVQLSRAQDGSYRLRRGLDGGAGTFLELGEGLTFLSLNNSNLITGGLTVEYRFDNLEDARKATHVMASFAHFKDFREELTLLHNSISAIEVHGALGVEGWVGGGLLKPEEHAFFQTRLVDADAKARATLRFEVRGGKVSGLEVSQTLQAGLEGGEAFAGRSRGKGHNLNQEVSVTFRRRFDTSTEDLPGTLQHPVQTARRLIESARKEGSQIDIRLLAKNPLQKIGSDTSITLRGAHSGMLGGKSIALALRGKLTEALENLDADVRVDAHIHRSELEGIESHTGVGLMGFNAWLNLTNMRSIFRDRVVDFDDVPAAQAHAWLKVALAHEKAERRHHPKPVKVQGNPFEERSPRSEEAVAAFDREVERAQRDLVDAQERNRGQLTSHCLREVRSDFLPAAIKNIRPFEEGVGRPSRYATAAFTRALNLLQEAERLNPDMQAMRWINRHDSVNPHSLEDQPPILWRIK